MENLVPLPLLCLFCLLVSWIGLALVLLCQPTITYVLRGSITDSTHSAIPPGNWYRTCPRNYKSVCINTMSDGESKSVEYTTHLFLGWDICPAFINMCSRCSGEWKSQALPEADICLPGKHQIQKLLCQELEVHQCPKSDFFTQIYVDIPPLPQIM